MPKKPKFSRELLLQEAYAIADAEGINEVSSRSIARNLGCSIQPIYTHFPTMAELRLETFRYASKQFTRELMSCRGEEDPFHWVMECTVDLARNRPNLFKLIFLTGGFSSRSLPEAILDLVKCQKVIGKIMELYDLSKEDSEDILVRCELFLLGVGTMLCSSHMAFSDAEIRKMTDRTVSDLVQGAKEGKKSS